MRKSRKNGWVISDRLNTIAKIKKSPLLLAQEREFHKAVVRYNHMSQLYCIIRPLFLLYPKYRKRRSFVW
nr:MAG TPA: hypothetical protein [Caudoviricetes sp.]